MLTIGTTVAHKQNPDWVGNVQKQQGSYCLVLWGNASFINDKQAPADALTNGWARWEPSDLLIRKPHVTSGYKPEELNWLWRN